MCVCVCERDRQTDRQIETETETERGCILRTVMFEPAGALEMFIICIEIVNGEMSHIDQKIKIVCLTT